VYQLLFLIHGMGAGERPTTDPDWWTDVVARLKDTARPFNHHGDFVTRAPKSGQVLVVPLTYHQEFDRIRAQWTQDAGGEAGFIPLLQAMLAKEGETPARDRVPKWVANAGRFFWTHVLDVVLYRYLSEFRTPIREGIAEQIAMAWHRADIDNATPDGGRTPVHFVAHSLGTSVLHDAISFLAGDPAYGPGTHRIGTMITCANVSAILETDFPAYASPDRPTGALPQPGGMTDAYFSFRHELDPIAAVHAFRGDLHGWPASGYRDTVPIDVKDWNVHGYTHYLDNPLVHLRLFEGLWDDEPWAERRDPAMVSYRASPGTPCPAAIAQARADLRAILADQWPSANALGLLELASRTVGVLGKARTACSVEQEGAP
jgi:hypothetical protein